METIYIQFGDPVYLNLKESMFIHCDFWTPRLRSLMVELLPQIYIESLRCYEASPIDYDYLIKRCNEMQLNYEILSDREEPQAQEVDNVIVDVNSITAENYTGYKTKPYKHQIDGIQFGLDNPRYLLCDDMGLGKALALNTKIYTPNGYKLMKDIEVGDYVFGDDGNPTKVINTYYHKNVKMYRITFSDGVSIDCCEDHLWQINTQHGTKVVDTKWFLQKNQFGVPRNQRLVSNSIYAYSIPRCNPVNFTPKEVIIHPYILGAILGDGCLTSSSVTITNSDKDLISRISDLLPDGYVLNSSPSMDNISYNIITTGHTHYNLVNRELSRLGLHKTNSHTKFIPDLYKYNSYEVRLELLRGLLDTDGYATKDNLLIYTTVSKQLAEDVRFLVESFGGIVHWHEKVCCYGGKVAGLSYNLTIRIDDPSNLMWLPRKKNLLKPRHFKPKRAIISVERIENADAKCITVDNESHLYLAEHFVVTHNTKTIIDLACISKLKFGYKHCLIVCCVNGLKWNWEDEVSVHSNEKCHILGNRLNSKKQWRVKGNAERLEDLISIRNGGFEDTYFFITNIETLRDKKIVKELKYLCDNKIIEMIAVDEIHKCASNSSQQSKGLLELNTECMVAMTGSPIMNNPLDLYVPLNWLGFDRHNFYDFKNHFCRFGRNNEINGFKNMEQIQSILQQKMIRRLKGEVLDLPEKIYSNEYVEMGKEQLKIYNEVLNGLREEVDLIARARNPLANLIRLRQATAHTSIISSTVSCSAKYDRCLELVKEYTDLGHKVIVFSNWTSVTDILKVGLLSYNPAVITGNTNDRQIQKDKFMNDPSCKVFIGTIGAAGTGLTLTAADVVIFMDEPWTSANKLQAEDRAHRIGTKNNVQIITLITKNTIDERINELVKKKALISENLIDNLDCTEITKLLNFLLF